MIVSIPDYIKVATEFQTAKMAPTDTGEAFKKARGALKPHSNDPTIGDLARQRFSDPVVLDKFERKLVEWARKPSKEALRNPLDIAPPFDAFERTFNATLQDPAVMAARHAKKVFKLMTFRLFEKGVPVDQLQGALAGLSPQTVAKVAYWKKSFDHLQTSGELESKFRRLEQGLAGL